MPEPAAARGPASGLAAGEAPLTLAESSVLAGGYRWVELRLFELLGSWVTRIPVPAAQVLLDAQSRRHAWHAALWADRLPRIADADHAALTVAPAGATVAVLGALDDAGGDGPGALPLLAGLYRVVLARLVASYERHLRACSPVCDGPVARVLRLVLADERTDLEAGEQLVRRLVARPHDVDAVHAFERRLEVAAVGGGTGPGLVPFPRPEAGGP